MAIDTRDKRASCLSSGWPMGTVLPNPDAAAEDGGDRQQMAYTYRGILAGAVVPTTAPWRVEQVACWLGGAEDATAWLGGAVDAVIVDL